MEQDKPCLYVYDTFNTPSDSSVVRWVGVLLCMRYMVLEGAKYPQGEIAGFGPTPGLALILARWFLRRKAKREAKDHGSGYPPLVREDCDG